MRMSCTGQAHKTQDYRETPMQGNRIA
ncbi:hypothetical protein MICRO8M_30152 [Microbacterium sp. 8M]|nr:hypothetical protein MICRO8M_30152 [Microbacterium sp. 8M]